jgi:diguanylate cyclase (GGDEF)-like protein/PAS domain S-box-containing protein/putative nucleotidyltransferase with HDIG domain
LSDLDVFFQISPDLLAISRIDGLYLKVNPAWKKILGYEPSEVEGKNSTQFIHPDDRINKRTLAKQLEDTHQIISFINRYRHSDGSYRYIEWDSQRDGDKIYSVARDITERNLKEEKIEYLSFHDMLTGLYNRRFLEEEMKRLDVPRNLPLTVIMGDVNRLKLVNDAFGHEKGDELIIKASESIKNSVRPEDLVARWGGDEFFILLPKTNTADAEKIVDRIHAACSEKSGNSIKVSIAFGVAFKAFLSESLAETMRLAEDAMYKSKAKDGERSRRDIIDVIATTLYSKIPFEEQHAKRVSFLCQQMATVLGFNKEDIQKLTLAGLLHDIGKIAVSSEILKKTDPLTPDDWIQLKTHTEIGAKVIGNGELMDDIGIAILHHHERYDGTGYPAGIHWEDIPVASRIISLADSFDTMISQTMYKPSKNRQEAINEIRKNEGTQFDPELAEIFISRVLGEDVNPIH